MSAQDKLINITEFALHFDFRITTLIFIKTKPMEQEGAKKY